MLLPQPDSPTTPSVSPLVDLEVDPVQGMHEAARLAPPVRADRETHFDPLEQDEGSKALWRGADCCVPSGRGLTFVRKPLDEPAGGAVCTAGVRRHQRRQHVALRLGEGATRPKAAALRRPHQVGNAAPDGRQRHLGSRELRQRAQQGTRVGMQRPPQHLLGRAFLDDPSGVHDVDPAAQLRDYGEVVRDEQHRGAARDGALAQQCQHLRLYRHVERRGRLVGDEDLRIAGERHGDQHALAHPATELEGVVAHDAAGVGHLHLGEQPLGARCRLPFAERLVAADDTRDLPADADGRVESGHRLLEDHRHGLAAQILERALGGGDDVPTEQHDGPGGDAAGLARQQAEHGHRGHRFAAAGLPDEADDLARTDLEPDAGQRLHRAAIGRELQREIADGDDGGRLWRHQRPLSRGSLMSRRPSPSRLNPTAVTRIARPGKVGYHH